MIHQPWSCFVILMPDSAVIINNLRNPLTYTIQLVLLAICKDLDQFLIMFLSYLCTCSTVLFRNLTSDVAAKCLGNMFWQFLLAFIFSAHWQVSHLTILISDQFK